MAGQARLGRSSVQASVLELTTKEGRCEGLGAREELVWHVLLSWLHTTVAHRRCCVQGVANLQCVLWLGELGSLCWESTRRNVHLLDSSHVLLDLSINLSIDDAFLSQLLHDLMLVGPLRILERQVSLTLFNKRN